MPERERERGNSDKLNEEGDGSLLQVVTAERMDQKGLLSYQQEIIFKMLAESRKNYGLTNG